MKKTFVCLSASKRGDETLNNAIVDYIGARKGTLIYGGGKEGAMGLLSSSLHLSYPAALQFVFTIPAYAHDVPEYNRFCKVCETLTDRLTEMMEGADEAIVLPGGLGTAQELLTLIEWSRTERQIPVVIVNDNGHYDWFVALTNQWIEEGYASPSLLNYFKVVDSFNEEAIAYLDSFSK